MGVRFAGTLKNMMGLFPFSTNGLFHLGKMSHLSQCIADLNLVRQPDLCISDATEFLTGNGPWDLAR